MRRSQDIIWREQHFLREQNTTQAVCRAPDKGGGGVAPDKGGGGGGTDDNSKIIFLIFSMKTYVVTLH